jgi:hypothetical protein
VELRDAYWLVSRKFQQEISGAPRDEMTAAYERAARDTPALIAVAAGLLAQEKAKDFQEPPDAEAERAGT